jgi:hypothetical protein
VSLSLVTVPKLTAARVAFVAFIAWLTYLLLVFPAGDLGYNIQFGDSFIWYYNALAPFFMSLIATLTGEFTSCRHWVGAWIAGVTILLTYGTMNVLTQGFSMTDDTIMSFKFEIVGVLLAILILRMWRFYSSRRLKNQHLKVRSD